MNNIYERTINHASPSHLAISCHLYSHALWHKMQEGVRDLKHAVAEKTLTMKEQNEKGAGQFALRQLDKRASNKDKEIADIACVSSTTAAERNWCIRGRPLGFGVGVVRTVRAAAAIGPRGGWGDDKRGRVTHRNT